MKRLSQIAAFASVFVLALMSTLHVSGLRINTSQSVAAGFYWKVHAPLQTGAYVLVCPPDTPVFQLARQRHYLHNGFCPNGSSGLMKRVAAAAGDRIDINVYGIRVNGALLPHSRPLPQDQGGRPLPQLTLANYRLSANELLLIGDVSAASFDSRYFGPIERAQIQGVVRPIWTW